MSSTMKYLGSVVLGLGLVATAHANTIVGGITITGASTASNAMDPAAAAGFMNFQVDQATGSFSLAGVRSGTAVSLFGFSLNPLQALGVVPLWHTVSGPLASFDMSQIVSVNRLLNGDVNLTGYGTLRLFGYDPTPGTWTYDSAGAGTFCFNANPPPGTDGSVPDGGTTAILLGASLCGLALFRRQLA